MKGNKILFQIEEESKKGYDFKREGVKGEKEAREGQKGKERKEGEKRKERKEM